jgi:hypothetical protein
MPGQGQSAIEAFATAQKLVLAGDTMWALVMNLSRYGVGFDKLFVRNVNNEVVLYLEGSPEDIQTILDTLGFSAGHNVSGLVTQFTANGMSHSDAIEAALLLTWPDPVGAAHGFEDSDD